MVAGRGRQFAGAGARPVGAPQGDIAARVFADKERLAGEHGQVGRDDVGEKPAGITAGDNQLAAASRRSIGHPETGRATRVVTLEQRPIAKDRKAGSKSGRKFIGIEQTAGIGAGNRQLAAPCRGPRSDPKIGIAARIPAGKHNSRNGHDGPPGATVSPDGGPGSTN